MQRELEPEVMADAAEAVAYDAMDHSGPNQAFVERLVELGAAGHMLDIGTGPGHIPLLVCEAIDGCHVTGVDLSAEMLAIAQRRRDASAFADRIVYRVADAKGLPFPDGRFDTVFSNTILHHLVDPRTLLAEAWRVLRPGGVLLIRDLFRPADQRTLDDLVRTYAGEESIDQRKLFRDSLKAALSVDELRAIADELGLSDVSVVVDTDRHMSLQTACKASS